MTSSWTSLQIWLFHHCSCSTSRRPFSGECPSATCHHGLVSPTGRGLSCTRAHCSSFPVTGSGRKGKKWLTWLVDSRWKLKSIISQELPVWVVPALEGHIKPYTVPDGGQRWMLEGDQKQHDLMEMCPCGYSPVCSSNWDFLSWRVLRLLFRSLWA